MTRVPPRDPRVPRAIESESAVVRPLDLWGGHERSVLAQAIHRRLMRGEWPDDTRPNFPPGALPTPYEAEIAAAWRVRAIGEYTAACHLVQLASALMLGAIPVGYSSTVTRFALDELRHADLCAAVVVGLGCKADLEWLSDPLLAFPDSIPGAQALFRNVLQVMCVSETISLAVLDCHLAAAECPQVVAVLRRIRADEAQHAQFGWEVAHLLAQQLSGDVVASEEARALGLVPAEFRFEGEGQLPEAIRHFGCATATELRKTVAEALAGPVSRGLAGLKMDRPYPCER